MTRANPTGLIERDSEIERIPLRKLQGKSVAEAESGTKDIESAIMAEKRRILFEHERPQFIREGFSVQAPTVVVNNYEIKASTIGMIQNSCKFNGLIDEDPNAHLLKFLQIYSTFKISTVTDDMIKL